MILHPWAKIGFSSNENFPWQEMNRSRLDFEMKHTNDDLTFNIKIRFNLRNHIDF